MCNGTNWLTHCTVHVIVMWKYGFCSAFLMCSLSNILHVSLPIFLFPHCMVCQRRLTTRKVSVRLFIGLSITLKCVDCEKTEERSVQIFIPYKRSFSLLCEILGQADPVGDKSPIFSRYSLLVLHVSRLQYKHLQASLHMHKAAFIRGITIQ